MGRAQAEAENSRQIANSVPRAEQGTLATPEESALEILLKAHGQLSLTLAEYDELSERCIEERQLREAEERSKTDTRMDRRQQMDMLVAPGEGLATSSRSPSPSRSSKPLPDIGRSGRATDSSQGHSSHGSHGDPLATQMAAHSLEPKRSRSPSPGRDLPIPPKISTGQSPPRSGSPLGRSRVPGPRPLPNPGGQYRSVHNSSNPNLVLTATEHSPRTRGPVTRDGSASSGEVPATNVPTTNGNAVANIVDDDGPRPSRKALGKRPALPVEESKSIGAELRLADRPLTLRRL